MVTKNCNVCIVGSFSLDTITVPAVQNNPFHRLGGATTYTSLAVKTLGETVSVVSRIGGDFPETHLLELREKGINISMVKRYQQEITTHFDINYSLNFSERALKLTRKGQPINPEDIPNDLRAKVIHVAPIADEINYEALQRLKTCCDILSLDPQGCLRNFDENGSVTPNAHANLQDLDLINICKLSQDELFALTGKSEVKEAISAVHDVGVETVIVTMGAKGSLLSFENVCYSVPAYRSTVIDPTGAGDVFIGAFLAEYLKDKETLWCASVGSAAASFIVEGLGSSYIGTKTQIYQRAQNICKNEKQ